MIYFYPHRYLRDRQLDTIRQWPQRDVLNPIITNRMGGQVDAESAGGVKKIRSWKKLLPLLNVKLRPKGLPAGAVVYVWGGLVSSGKFIVDLDTPWAMVGYNLRAMPLYRRVIRYLLLSERCLGIRCMSMSCRESLGQLFGAKVYRKAELHYPKIPQFVTKRLSNTSKFCRFLFVGTQFEIKGGISLLKAFQRVYARRKGECQLDVVTHLPAKLEPAVKKCNGINLYAAEFTREEIYSRFMKKADVLILPTFVESFGMVALEALAHGLAIIATDVYALGEMVENGKNGCLLKPPISIWDGVMPSKTYYNLLSIKDELSRTDARYFESELEVEIERFIDEPEWRNSAKQASVDLMRQRFLC